MYEPLSTESENGHGGGTESVQLAVLGASRVYRDPTTHSEAVPESVGSADGARRESCFGSYDCGEPVSPELD